MKTASAVCGIVFCAAGTLGAQALRTGRVEGTVTQAVRSRSIRNASVEAVRVDAEPSTSFRTSPDDAGHFLLDSLPAGRYVIQLGSAALDSLDLALPLTQLNVIAGQTVHADLSLPVGRAVRDAVCEGVRLGKGRGAVAGHATDADTEQPLAGAKVVVAWIELTVDKATLRARRLERAGVVQTGRRGEYRLCGVPTSSLLSIQLQQANHASGVARVTVTDEEGAVVRNLSLSLRDAPTLAALDSVENAVQRMDAPGGATADTSGVPFLVGTAAVTGIVRGAAGLPVADAEVRVANAAPIAATDSAGRYTLRGLPAGTQLLFARRIGYATLEADIELRAGRSTGRDVQLQRVVSLDSIRVIGQRSRYREFEYDRGSSFFGKFLTGDEIERYKANELTDILLHLGGFTISGRGLTATVLSNAVKQRHPACTESNVVIDGVDQAGINYYPPTQVAGLEVYRDGTTAPALYRSDCGLILIWTKRYRAPPRHEAPPDSVVVPAPHVSSGAFPSGRHGVQQGSLDLDAMDPAEQHRIGQGSHHASE